MKGSNWQLEKRNRIHDLCEDRYLAGRGNRKAPKVEGLPSEFFQEFRRLTIIFLQENAVWYFRYADQQVSLDLHLYDSVQGRGRTSLPLLDLE